MTTLIIVRSCTTDWNKTKRIQGTVDVPLNEEGKAAAEKISSQLSNLEINCIFSSSLSRSFETAQVIARNHSIKTKKIKELNALNRGLWQGLCVDEIKKRYKKQYSLWMSSPFSTKPPKGEGLKEAYDRVVNTVQKIIDKHKNGIICIVSHNIVISLIKCHFTGQDINKIWSVVPGIGAWEKIEIGNDAG